LDEGHSRGVDFVKPKKACGRYNLKMTAKRKSTRTDRWEAKCPHCKKRTNLNPGRVQWFTDKLEAKARLEELNNGK